MSIKIVKRGRPSKADLAMREKKQTVRSDSQILSDLKERFDILSLLTKGAVAQNIRAMVVTGAPGVGKTYTVEQILEHSNVPHEIVRGSLSAIHLYMLAYKYRKPGNVIVLVVEDRVSIVEGPKGKHYVSALGGRAAKGLREGTQLKLYRNEGKQMSAYILTR